MDETKNSVNEKMKESHDERDAGKEKVNETSQNETFAECEKPDEGARAAEDLAGEIKDLKDKLLRRAAEFENYKRRVENEKSEWFKYASEALLKKILPIYDDLIRSRAHISEEGSIDSIVKGIGLIIEKFKKTLEEEGVKKIETVGKPFDFNFHEALLQRSSSEHPPHTVLDEVEPGYVLLDKVIRHAKVIVSDENSGGSGENNDIKAEN